MIASILISNAAFFVLACACLVWAQLRTGDQVAAFPGPRPVGIWFKGWLLVIWAVGLLLPLAALLVDGAIGGHSLVWWALGPYLVMFIAQVLSELFVWKRWRSPVWVIVPCLYLPWRLYQIRMGLDLPIGPDMLMTTVTLYALLILWIINIGVHFTNIPNTLRWDYHSRDAKFPSLRDPRVFTANAQD
jgi:hypothetical protein